MAKKNRMKFHDIVARLSMLDRCGYRCIICGERFESLECVTYEHVVPKSRSKGMLNNRAPSHYNCNQFRGVRGLGDAWRAIEEMRELMGEANFRSWLNKKVPDRNVPDYATQPPEFVRCLFGRRCGELKGPANDTRPVQECTVDAEATHATQEQRVPVCGVGQEGDLISARIA